MSEVIRLVGEIMGNEPNVERIAAQRGDARHTSADTTRAQQELGFAPTRTVRDGLGEQIAWQRDRVALLPPV
jgi:nucleoside-diphosphate-sugar epimerase